LALEVTIISETKKKLTLTKR